MDTFYTNEKQVQILIALMKAHGIKKIIASPGTTNICLVASIQQDPYFEIYSAADERSAAYMACGLAVESGESVALSCTGATASRNYIPALTEAFYRKIPILAITSTQTIDKIGHNIPQIINRDSHQKDIFKLSIQISMVNNEEDKWACETQINKALLELKHHGGGPVHINLTTMYSKNFTVKELPNIRIINRICCGEKLPKISANKIGIFVGAHKKWNKRLTESVDKFCELYNAVVFCDHSSNYKGKYRVIPALIASQDNYKAQCCSVDLLIHIGDISGAYISIPSNVSWRVNPDGEVCDTFRNLQYTFEMAEETFFEEYVKIAPINHKENSFLLEWQNEYKKVFDKIPELPFSNPWIAQKTITHLPENSVLHLGILNSLRSWNYFEISNTILSYSNTGGFGIDGNVSSLIGASLANPNKLYFLIVGDLAFFYDMNSLGNRHVGKNIRIMLINNGRGTEFRNYNHPGARFKDDADAYIAAAGHYGNKSPLLIKHYAEDLGFKYLCARNKEEYLKQMDCFVDSKIQEQPILFEVFTDTKDESDAHKIIRNIEKSTTGIAKNVVKNILGEQGIHLVKKLMNK